MGEPRRRHKKPEGDTKYINVASIDEKTFRGMYKIKEKLGEGSFGKVLRVVSKEDKNEYAMKIVKKTKLDPETAVYLNREIEIMKKINHPNCCRLHAVHKTSSAVYMLLEFLRGGDLFNRIVNKKHFDEKQAARVTKEVAETLKYLHSIGIIHRDLKPDNIMFRDETRDSQVVLADFGLAKHLDSKKKYMSSACGTPSYEAPEVIRRRGKTRHYTSQCDMWSLGVVLYAMLSGREPFKARHRAELADKICHSRYTFPDRYWGHVSDQAKSLIEGLLVVDPTKRFTPQQVIDHPWIKDPEKPALNLVNLQGYHKNLKYTKAMHTFSKVVKFIIRMNRLRAILAIDRREIRRKLGLRSPAMSRSNSMLSFGVPETETPPPRGTTARTSKWRNATSPKTREPLDRKRGGVVEVLQKRTEGEEAKDHGDILKQLNEVTPQRTVRASASEADLSYKPQSINKSKMIYSRSNTTRSNTTSPTEKRGMFHKYKEEQVGFAISSKNLHRNDPLKARRQLALRKGLRNEPAEERVQRSMSDVGEKRWQPEAGDGVLVKGWKAKDLTLQRRYEGVIEYMRNQEYWWVADASGALKVAPLADIRRRELTEKETRKNASVSAIANAKAVLDRATRATLVKQRAQIVHSFDLLLSFALEVEGARDELMSILVSAPEKHAVLLFVDIKTFKKTYRPGAYALNSDVRFGGSEPAGMRLRANEIYRAFIQDEAPLNCPFIRESTRENIVAILNEKKKLTVDAFNESLTDCLAYLKKTTWNELTKLWIILVQLWRQIIEGNQNMDSKVKVLRNYMPKPFMRFYGSPALCLVREGFEQAEGIDTQPFDESKSIYGGSSSRGKRPVEKSLFKEGFLKKRFLTRQGFAQRYVRILLEEDPEERSTSFPKVMFCYYDTNDDEDIDVAPGLRMQIDEHFVVTRDEEDSRCFTVSSAKYQKLNHSVNAMVELASNGLTLRARTIEECEDWVNALCLFIPTTKHIDLTLKKVLEQAEYQMKHLETFLQGNFAHAGEGVFGAHGFVFKRFPWLAGVNRRMVRIGLLGTLRDFFADQWDPAFASAWRFFDQLNGGVSARTRMHYHPTALSGKELLPDFDKRRLSLLQSFRSLFNTKRTKTPAPSSGTSRHHATASLDLELAHSANS